MVHKMTCHNLYNPQSLGSISWDIHTTYDFHVTKVLVSLAFSIWTNTSYHIRTFVCVSCKHTLFHDCLYPQHFLHVSPDNYNNLTWTVYYDHYMKYILKSCKTKQTCGSVNFWCCQETTETLFLIDRQALTLDNTAAAAFTRLRSRLYVQANGSLCLL